MAKRPLTLPVLHIMLALADGAKHGYAIKLDSKADRVLGFIASSGDRDLMTVETSRGAEQTISTAKYEVTGRGGKGRELLQRGQFTRIVPTALEAPPPFEE